MQILGLIRFKNLFMITFIQCLFKYVFFALPQFQNIPTALNTSNFTILVLATICIAAAGYIINDIQDVEADNINKPSKVIINKGISENLANNLFMVLTVLGIGFGTYVSWQIGKNSFATIFLLVSALLYFYATSLKQTILIGNFVIAALVGLSILIVGVFEIAPMVTPETKDAYLFMFKFLIDYALFAFLLNLVRELVKDIEDVDGDYKAGYNTLPIAIGRNRASKVAFAICLLTIIAIFYYVITYLFENQTLLLYFIFLIIGPLAHCAIKLITAKHKKHFADISLILKITMFIGMFSIVVLKFV